MSIRKEQCNKVCRILDDVLANRPTERDSLIVAVRKAFETLELFGNSEQLPSAQQERPKGNWVEIGDEPYDEWECDMCGFVIDGSGCIDPEEYKDVYKFCPNCGADMRGKE